MKRPRWDAFAGNDKTGLTLIQFNRGIYRSLFFGIYLITVIVLMSSCGSAKYVPDNEYLLRDYDIEDEQNTTRKEEIKTYVKQRPNKKILGLKFYLSLYNLSRKEKDNGFNNWLRNIGEPPVVFNPDLTDKTTQQLELYLYNKGYFNAEVNDSVVYKRRKADVYYTIDAGHPYTIRNIDYFFEDASLSEYVMNDSIPSLLEEGQQYNVEMLQAERVRIERILRNRGYFNFTREFVYFEVDSSVGQHQVDLMLGISNYPVKDEQGRVVQTRHKVYSIRDVNITTDYKLLRKTGNAERNVADEDTLLYDDIHVIFKEKPNVRPGLVTQKNFVIPGEVYNATDVERTYRNLTSLSAFRLVDIKFREVDGERPVLDCDIKLLPATKQSYTFEIEGTNSGGNIGVAGNIIYQHRNLFRGSEQFDLRFTGAIETLRESQRDELRTMQEWGVEARLRIPKFLLPFRTEQFIRKYNPQTNLSLSFNYQKRPDYTRTTLNSGFGYDWKGGGFFTHTVYPFESSLIRTPFMSSDFREWLEGTYLFYSYQPHFILNQRYNVVFNNQQISKSRDFQYFRFSAETAANFLYLLHSVSGAPTQDGVYQIFGVDYAQYVRADIDFRHYDYLDEGISLVYRGFIGVGIPYLNSAAMPFEKQYFAGGANSIRAFQVRNLGPGSFPGDTASIFPNQTADLKIEANVEYRFKLFWKLEGAFFLDAGNIWSVSPDDDREGALFDLKRFYKEFAVGTGFGTRLDFDFFIFRLDMGVPLVDPSYQEGERWLPSNKGISWRDLTFNLAIGYPF